MQNSNNRRRNLIVLLWSITKRHTTPQEVRAHGESIIVSLSKEGSDDVLMKLCKDDLDVRLHQPARYLSCTEVFTAVVSNQQSYPHPNNFNEGCENSLHFI